MEAILAAPSAERQAVFPPYKQMKNPTKKSGNTRGFPPSRLTESMVAPFMNTNNIHAGLLFAPPPPSLSFSCPPSLLSVPYNLQINPRQQQPPLLPFPVSKPYNNSSNTLPSRTKSLSFSPTTKKTNRARDHSLTPKKSKKPTKRSEEPKQDALMVVASTVPTGPDPNDLPKDVFTKFTSPPPSPFTSLPAGNDIALNDLEGLSGLVSTVLSPPPSSLPLPKFSMRPPKLMSCTAEAAGVDAGATDNLCRLLRLR